MTAPVTPFSTDGVYPGADPGDVAAWRSGSFRFWLGPVGNLIELPSVYAANYTAPGSLGEVEHALANGTSAVTRFDSMTRRWTLGWDRLAGRDWKVVNGFYRRLFGPDPWAYLNPEDVNRLTLAQSLCGTLHAKIEGWQVSVGVAAYDATVAAPIIPCGVIRWTGATSGAVFSSGVYIPYVPALSWTFQTAAWVASGTRAATLRLSGRDATGAIVLEQSQSIALTATPQTFTVTAQPMALGASVNILAELLAADSAAADILISTPQVTESNVTDWWAGSGVPRVALVAPLGRAPDPRMNSGATLTLAETSYGAA